MARQDEMARVRNRKPQTPEELRLCEHVRAVFGWTPDSIRQISTAVHTPGLCAVEINSGCENSMEFICSEGMLICCSNK